MSLEPEAAEEIILETHETTAAAEEKSKLKKHFGRFDMLFFLICTLVGVDTLGAVASNGPEGFTWLIFLAIFFFVVGVELKREFVAGDLREPSRAALPSPRPSVKPYGSAQPMQSASAIAADAAGEKSK